MTFLCGASYTVAMYQGLNPFRTCYSPQCQGSLMPNKTYSNEMLSPSLKGRLGTVKCSTVKNSSFLLKVFTVMGLAAALALPAQAEDAQTRTMLNSTQLITLLDGVIPSGLPNILAQISSGKVPRIAPQSPVWILETQGSTILYYQGQPSFTGQNATRLVDDNGFRFGQRALDQALRSRSTWLTLTLGGAPYKAYCASRAPYVVCSLLVA